VSKVTLLAFAALFASLALSGCGGGAVEETTSIAGSTASDTTPPSNPAGLTAAAASPSQINLSWTAATDNAAAANNSGVAGYNVYRNGLQIATLGIVTTFQNTGLTFSTTYSYMVRAFDVAGNVSTPSSTASATTLAAPDTTAPSTPAGLTATAASASQINLSWTAATDNVGVTGYNVYRGGIQIATLGAVTTYQNTGLTASTGYSYTVQALDAAGNASALSSSTGATTPATTDITAPSTPAGLTAAAASPTQINLSWAAATDNIGVTGYNVFRGGTQIATLGAVTTYQNTGLTASTAYSYTVRAFDAAGNASALSSAAGATTPAAPDTAAPSTPAGLTATAASSAQINLSWSAATDNVGVTGYNVFRGGTQIATLGAVTTFQNSGLTASTSYSYTVQALDAAGNASALSALASATTQAPAPDTTAPSTPAGLTATAASSSQINLSWSAATDNIGVTGYNVFRGGTQIATLGAVTTYQNTGLTASTSYSYTVQALDAAGNASALSTLASATTPAAPDTTAPSTPAGLTATAASFSQINLSWAAATDNVGVTGYNVFRGGAQIATLGAVTTYQNTGLTASTSYSYTVRAFDAAGNASAQSSSIGATTPAAPDTTAPSTPAGLTAMAASFSQINLSWAAATDNIGVTGYNVFRGGAQIATLGAVTTYQNTGLTASTSYTYTVRAFDAAGNISAPSSSAIAATPAAPDITAPSIPAGLIATAASSSRINLSWTAATDNVGVTGYNVYRGGMQIATLGAVTTFQNTGLAASTTYSYTVQAFDAAGNASGPSTAASATTLVPGTTATLAWDAVTATNLSGYRVYYGTAPGTYLQSLGQGLNVGNVTTHTVTGLSSGTRYYFAVTAFDTSNSESTYSNEVFKDIP
jgi:chitodextrinase